MDGGREGMRKEEEEDVPAFMACRLCHQCSSSSSSTSKQYMLPSLLLGFLVWSPSQQPGSLAAAAAPAARRRCRCPGGGGGVLLVVKVSGRIAIDSFLF